MVKVGIVGGTGYTGDLNAWRDGDLQVVGAGATEFLAYRVG